MGFQFGLESANMCMKRKFRWLYKIPKVCGEKGANALPPLKGNRPGLGFKEMEAQHLIETVYYPSKPEWKPLSLTLYDLKTARHPVIEWYKKLYDAEAGTWTPSATAQLKQKATIEIYDGAGTAIETWVLENTYPQNIEFGELDMGSSDFLTVELTLRYDRAYQE